MEGMLALGEADVKFTRYADLYSKLMVDSIDGDSVPIALMHLERRMRSTTPQRLPQVSIYRMELRQTGTERTAGMKRPQPATATTRDEQDDDMSSGAKRREKRTYEFVHVNALYWGLMQAVAQCTGRIAIPTHRGHEMAMLVSLIALTGTDFTRNLPQMTGKSVFSFLPDIWSTLAAAYDPERTAMRVETATDMLVAHLYRTKFPRLFRDALAAGPVGLEGTLAELKGSKMAQKNKDMLPSVSRITCTVCNSNWVLAYWGGDGDRQPPDPIQPMYGFGLLPNGATQYADELACP